MAQTDWRLEAWGWRSGAFAGSGFAKMARATRRNARATESRSGALEEAYTRIYMHAHIMYVCAILLCRSCVVRIRDLVATIYNDVNFVMCCFNYRGSALQTSTAQLGRLRAAGSNFRITGKTSPSRCLDIWGAAVEMKTPDKKKRKPLEADTPTLCSSTDGEVAWDPTIYVYISRRNR